MTIETPPPEKKPSSTWTTVFEINPDAFLEVQRILDILRHKNDPPVIDPEKAKKIAKEEAEDLWGSE